MKIENRPRSKYVIRNYGPDYSKPRIWDTEYQVKRLLSRQNELSLENQSDGFKNRHISRNHRSSNSLGYKNRSLDSRHNKTSTSFYNPNYMKQNDSSFDGIYYYKTESSQNVNKRTKDITTVSRNKNKSIDFYTNSYNSIHVM